eukprot:m.1518367 g.1518367  ORF g.1518367 m.1518367 type:complete len:1053 (-) comp25221_c3_seq1:295-3453(-)
MSCSMVGTAVQPVTRSVSTKRSASPASHLRIRHSLRPSCGWKLDVLAIAIATFRPSLAVLSSIYSQQRMQLSEFHLLSMAAVGPLMRMPGNSNQGMDAGVIVLKSGFAVKEGQKFKTWRRRWCILRTVLPTELKTTGVVGATHVLAYYKNERDAAAGQTPCGAIGIIKGKTLANEEKRGSRTCLKIHTPGTTKVFYLQPCSDMVGWQQMLVDLEPAGDSDELRRMTLPKGVGRVYTAEEVETNARGTEFGDEDPPKGKSSSDHKSLDPADVVAPDELRRNSVLSQRIDSTGVLRPPSDLGISIGVVHRLLEQVKQRQTEETPMTTRTLVQDIILPASGAKSYAEHLQSSQEDATADVPCVGPACVFVTHAWDDSAQNLLESIVYHNNRVIKGLKRKQSAPENSEPEPLYYWVDICCLDQGETGNAAMIKQKSDERWWSAAFPSLIQDIGYSIVVLSPPVHGVASTVVSQRAWCLYELVVAYGVGVNIDVVHGPSTDALLEEQLCTSFATLADAAMAVDGSTATTSTPEDLESIRRVMESLPGEYSTVDDIFKSLVKGWIVRVMRGLCDEQRDETEAHAQFAFEVGSVLRQSGDLDASIVYLLKSMNMFEATIGAAHPTMVDVCNSLGVSYANKGDYDNGIHFYNMAMRIYTACDSVNQDKLAQSYNNLGLAHAAKGEFDVAIDFYERDLALTEAKLGANDPTLGGIYNNLSSAYYNKGLYTKAIEFLEKEKNIIEATHGAEHEALAELYNLLALSHWKLGNKDKSIAFFELDKELSGKILGFDHPNMAQQYSNLGTTYMETEQYDIAIEHFERALAIYSAELDAHDPLVRKAYENLALAHESKEDYGRALECYVKVHAINESTVEALHPLRADSCQHIGRMHTSLGAYDEAIKYFTKAKGIVQVIFGADHPLMGHIDLLLGDAQEQKGEFDKAIELYTVALDVLQAAATASAATDGADSAPHSDTMSLQRLISTALKHIVSACMQKKDFDGAVTFSEKNLVHVQAIMGTDPSAVTAAYKCLGDAHKSNGDDSQAAKCYAQADALAASPAGAE